MSRGRVALPYRTPSPETVDAGVWHLHVNGLALEVGDHIPDWDYNTNLSLSRRIHVDVGRLNEEVALPMGTEFAISVVWSASGSSQRAQAYREVVSGEGTTKVAAEFMLVGADLGGTVELETFLTLAEDLNDAPDFAPRLGGSVLWTDSKVIRLQGEAPQFPIAVVDFAATDFPEDAGWYLQIGRNLEGAAMGSLLLCINEANSGAANAFKNAGNPQVVDAAVVSAVYADVARTLIEYALTNPEFDDESEFPEDSLGAILQGLVQRYFPDSSLDDLRKQRENSPAWFSSAVQGAVRVFEDIS
ncbi:hypothetical protein L618_002200000640 [Rhodococcus rhodochrous J45]|uniref:Uncharacterized protein n=1 Tax=Rhodococcus rhodochrous J45 TaxID=935266 RepID=A0A562E4M4_RHORH|nr:hypothetical protein L618_002200000640 [Rhodococcus rhodochrous J45]